VEVVATGSVNGFKRGVDRYARYGRAKIRLALSRVGARKSIWPMNISKTAIKPDVILTTGNCPTLSQCGKGVWSLRID